MTISAQTLKVSEPPAVRGLANLHEAARRAHDRNAASSRGIHETASRQGTVPAEFVAADFSQRAYEDAPLPIGDGQPFRTLHRRAMTWPLRLRGHERVLK